VAAAASPATALSYTNAIVSYCEGLNISPHHGSRRDDVRPGLRVTNYKKRVNWGQIPINAVRDGSRVEPGMTED